MPNTNLPRAQGLRYLLKEPSKTTGYKVKRPVNCTECVMVIYENGGKGDIHPARLRRRCQTRDLYLCYGHAHLWRVDDGRRIA